MDCTQLSAETPCFLIAAGIALGRTSSAEVRPEGEAEDVDAKGDSGPRESASRANSGLVGSTMPQELHKCGF